jgi:hypothetical protein
MDISPLGAHPIDASEGHVGPVDNSGIAGLIDGRLSAYARSAVIVGTKGDQMVFAAREPPAAGATQLATRRERVSARDTASQQGAKSHHAPHFSGPGGRDAGSHDTPGDQQAERRHPQLLKNRGAETPPRTSLDPRGRNAGTRHMPSDRG